MTATTTSVPRTTADQGVASLAFVAGAAATAVAGMLVQIAVVPTTDVPDERWSYPWEPGLFVVVSLVYALLHLLVAVGLVAFDRSGVAGPSRSGRVGVMLAVAGTLVLAAAEILSIPIRDAFTDDTSAQLVGAVFGLGILLSAIGFVLAGVATMKAGVWRDRRRFTPLATGISSSVLVVLPIVVPGALAGGVAVYGACLLAMAIALHRA